MAYSWDLAVAARRHLRAANELNTIASAGAQPGCSAVAGYLYGLSGELAVKRMMMLSGMRPLPPGEPDPYYAHFPNLKHRLKDNAEGRRAGELRKIAEDPALFRNWDTKMRYAPTGEIPAALVAAWKASAEALVQSMDLE